MDFSNVRDKVYLITGGGGVCGGQTAVLLSQWGACVALVDINAERLIDKREQCLQVNGASDSKILTYVGDVTKEDDVTSFINAVVAKFNRIDGIFNVVGGKLMGTIHTARWSDIVWVSETIIKSTFLMVQGCLPHLKATKGSIVNMGASAGTRPCYHALGYSIFKAALERFTDATAAELAPYGVRCNAIAPVTLEGDDYHSVNIKSAEAIQTYLEWTGKVVPLGRPGVAAQDIAPITTFLLSDRSAFCTGATIQVDGAYGNTVY